MCEPPTAAVANKIPGPNACKRCCQPEDVAVDAVDVAPDDCGVVAMCCPLIIIASGAACAGRQHLSKAMVATDTVNARPTSDTLAASLPPALPYLRILRLTLRQSPLRCE